MSVKVTVHFNNGSTTEKSFPYLGMAYRWVKNHVTYSHPNPLRQVDLVTVTGTDLQRTLYNRNWDDVSNAAALEVPA